MSRCPAEERELLTVLPEWLADKPNAGFIVGTVQAGTPDDGYTVQVGHCDCDPIGLVALATELLIAASEKLRTRSDNRAVVELICSIERARAALEFEVPEHDA